MTSGAHARLPTTMHGAQAAAAAERNATDRNDELRGRRGAGVRGGRAGGGRQQTQAHALRGRRPAVARLRWRAHRPEPAQPVHCARPTALLTSPTCFIMRLPKERETASTPPTRHVPAHTTAPPAPSMRCCSSARLGLWSRESACAPWPTEMTALRGRARVRSHV